MSTVHIGGVELIGCQVIKIWSTKHFLLWNVRIDSSAVHLLNDKYVTIEDSTFSNGQGVNGSNSLLGKVAIGGAMLVTNSTMWITNSTFENNRADLGGALYINESNVTMNECQFQHSEANVCGGSILAFNAFILGKQCSYYGNSAQYGGVLPAYQSEIIYSRTHTSVTTKLILVEESCMWNNRVWRGSLTAVRYKITQLCLEVF